MIQSEAIIRSLETGNPSAVLDLISEDRYIQHNQHFPDGRQILVHMLPELPKAGTKARPVRSFVDGDYAVHHTEYVLFGKHQVGFDVFRSENGKVVEHWDNLQEWAGPNPDGNSMIDGATTVTDLERTASNKRVVEDLITEVFQNHQYQKLPEYISTTTYIQHNPHVADGLAGLKAAGPLLAKFQYRKVHKILGQGNFVLAMSEIGFDGQDAAVYDLFRLEGGKVVEHWDVLEMALPAEQRKNANGKF
jgi:predicted SnoaL-like aldol condensation-catalyzing enzyme